MTTAADSKIEEYGGGAYRKCVKWLFEVTEFPGSLRPTPRMAEIQSDGTEGAPYEPQLLSKVVRSHADAIASWSDLEGFLASLYGGLDRWCFRGHRCAEWALVSTLDRLASRNRRSAETFLIREFQRSAHHFLPLTPNQDDILEWLALMQHHGAPTRLLDFTLSPYIGVYFALENFPIDVSTGGDFSPFLWAVNYVSCKGIALSSLVKLLGRSVDHGEKLAEPSTFRKCFLENHREYFIVPIQSRRHNERQSVQQSVFLCPSSVDFSFEVTFVQPEEFHVTMGSASANGHIEREAAARENLKRLVRCAKLTPQGAVEIITRLQRMNINAESLFPGIDGYARAIKEKFRAIRSRPPADQQWEDYYD